MRHRSGLLTRRLLLNSRSLDSNYSSSNSTRYPRTERRAGARTPRWKSKDRSSSQEAVRLDLIFRDYRFRFGKRLGRLFGYMRGDESDPLQGSSRGPHPELVLDPRVLHPLRSCNLFPSYSTRKSFRHPRRCA